LDPFSGAATTGLVGTQLGRGYIGIEANPKYAEMGRDRIRRYEANPAGSLTGDPKPIAGQIGMEID
jgi:DNA modification methylase